jgi:hypothetical protein
MIEAFRRRLGRWALPVWFICGLAAFGVFVAAAECFTPELVQAPTDRLVWTLDAFLFLLCLLGGPLAMAGALLLFFVVGVVTRLV